MSGSHQKLFHVKEHVRGGIHPSEDYAENVLWGSGMNVLGSERALRPILGQSVFLPRLSTDPVLGVFEVEVNGIPNLFWGTQSKLIRYIAGDSTQLFDVGAADHGLTRSHIWSFEEYGNMIFACNGTAGETIWLMPGDQVTLPLTPASVFTEQTADVEFDDLAGAHFINKMNSHLLIFNTDIDAKAYHWCDLGDGLVWIPTTANAAGIGLIREMSGEIKGTGRLRDNIIVYGQSESYLLQYLGAPLYFGHKLLAPDAGIWSQSCVVSTGLYNYGFGPDGVWVTDGMQVVYVDRPDMYNYIFSNLNRDLAHLSCVWHNSMENCIAVFWPSLEAQDLDMGVYYHYKDKTWWPVSYVRTCGTDKKVFDFGITGGTDGSIYRQLYPQRAGEIGEEFPPVYVPSIGGSPLNLNEGVCLRQLVDDYTCGFGECGDVKNVNS